MPDTELIELFHDAVVRDPSLRALAPRFPMFVEDLSQRSNAELQHLAPSSFPKLALWALRDARTPGKLPKTLDDWAHLLKELAATDDGLDALSLVLRHIANVGQEPLFEDFRDALEELTPEIGANMTTIAQRMRREGRSEGRIESLSELIALKFGALCDEDRGRLERASPEQLEAWTARILSANTLGELFGE